MDINLKDLFKLDNIMGKKLVLILYYFLAVAIVINLIASFIGGIVYLVQGSVLIGLGGVLFSLPLALLYFIIARVACELVSALFDLCGKNGDQNDSF